MTSDERQDRYTEPIEVVEHMPHTIVVLVVVVVDLPGLRFLLPGVSHNP